MVYTLIYFPNPFSTKIINSVDAMAIFTVLRRKTRRDNGKEAG